jgi:pimeloyl-ACP methyl ester carboxylesterase
MRILTGLALTLAAGALVACSSAPGDEKPAGPRFEEVGCPDDVEVLVVPAHRCGYVVPDDTDPRRIFVVEVQPPEPTDLSPVLETGTDLGMTPGYGGLAPIAQRTGRRVVIVDLPGTGHSEPSMDCPQAEALGDATPEAELIAAIAECRDRVEAEGLDPGLVTPDRLGEALFAVMEALGEPRWVVMGHGTTGEAGRQVALAHPERVEALVLDSVVTDPGAEVAEVVESVGRACHHDVRCARRYGNLELLWDRAIARLSRRPLTVEVGDTTVAIDPATLERAVRWIVAPSSLGPGLLPAMLAEAASGRPSANLELFARTVSVAPPLCVGFVPKCETGQRLVIGSTLSAICPAVADTDAWSAACETWGVDAGDTDIQPLTGVPTLALFGDHDPYADATAIRAGLLERVPEAFVVEQVAGGHNVLGSECPREARNVWLTGDVANPPPELPCLSDPIDFQP